MVKQLAANTTLKTQESSFFKSVPPSYHYAGLRGKKNRVGTGEKRIKITKKEKMKQKKRLPSILLRRQSYYSKD
jgi:hypothetical protein